MNQKKFIWILLNVSVLLASCESEKTLMKCKNCVYSVTSSGSGSSSAGTVTEKYNVDKAHKVKITEGSGYLIFQEQPSTSNYSKVETISYSKPNANTASWKNDNAGWGFFPEKNDAGTTKNGIWYRDWRFVLQTATIPIKIRPAVTETKAGVSLGDSIPGQVETGFSIGFVPGAKHTWYKFRTTPNVFGQLTDRYSITFGGIFSIGGTDLKATTTRPKITFDRKAAFISVGAVAVIGFNSINIGYALGFDFTTGKNSGNWLYQGKPWHGIIVSLDLIK